MHSKAHAEFNDAWRSDDYNLDRFQAWLARKDSYVKNLHPKIQLAITCAFEHFTALLGGYILRHPEVLSTLYLDAVKLWVWHAIEEIEHRSVAFDVYQHVYGDDKIRRMIMRSVTTGFASLTFYSATKLFMQDRKKSLPKVGGNIFGTYLLGKMFIRVNSRIFILLQTETFILLKLITRTLCSIGNSNLQMNTMWKAFKRSRRLYDIVE